MKKRRLFAAILAAALAVSTLAGCGRSSGGSTGGSAAGSASAGSASAASDDQITVGYACVDMNNTFQTYLVDAASKKADELGVKFVMTDAQNDVVKQQDQIKAMLQQGVDAMIVVAADSSAMEPVTAAVTAAGIPLVYCNINPYGDATELPDGVYYVGSDETEAGRMNGTLACEAAGGKGGVAILMGGLVYEASYKRTDGIKEIVAQYPDMKVLAEETAEWQRDKAIDVTNNWLTAFGDELKVVAANNDEMALGALEALKAAGRTDVVVTGVDAIPDACESIKKGELLGTVFQDSKGQGGGAMEIAVKAIKGEAVEDFTWVPYIPVYASNVDEYIGKN